MSTREEKRNCDIHGEYIGKFFSLTAGIEHGGNCPTCQKEAEDKRQADRREIELRNEKKRRLSKRVDAGISKRNLGKSFDDFICKTKAQEEVKKTCLDYVESFPTDKSMIMCGGVGTGKTLLACSIIESLVDRNKCQVINIINIVRNFKKTWKHDYKYTEQDVLDHYVNLDLLIIDEVGMQFGSDTEKLFIFDVINGRYEETKPTILISNLDIQGIKNSIGERCVDRLKEGGGIVVALGWESQRA